MGSESRRDDSSRHFLGTISVIFAAQEGLALVPPRCYLWLSCPPRTLILS